MTNDETPARGEAIDVRIAWRRNDPVIEADAIAMWRALHVLPPDVAAEQRAKEPIAVVRKNERLRLESG